MAYMVSDTESRDFRLGRRATTRKLTEAQQKYRHENINRVIGSLKWSKQKEKKTVKREKTRKEGNKSGNNNNGKLLKPKCYTTTYGLKSFRYKGA